MEACIALLHANHPNIPIYTNSEKLILLNFVCFTFMAGLGEWRWGLGGKLRHVGVKID